LSSSDIEEFSNLLDTVRNFINTAYVPDVVTVATLSSPNYSQFWSAGTNPGNLLSYGDFPIQTGTNPETLLLQRGLTIDARGATTVDFTTHPTAFLANVREYVGYSYYDAGSAALGYPNDGLHPSVGVTAPDVDLVGSTNQQYSWLKAPRYFYNGTDNVCEVGPLARVYNTVFGDTTNAPVVSEAKGTLTTANITVTPLTHTALGGTPLAGGTYTLAGMTLAVVGALPIGAADLVSVLGRHAARALECKYIADAMASTGAAQSWLTELNTLGATSPTYIYAKLPKKISLGAGWAEAPRGALGHWITIDKKRVASYQCVVPTTWNHGPRDTAGNRGPAEQVLIGAAVGTDTDSQVLNTMRFLHPYDFCIACAVHLVRPDGSTIAKVKWDTDGKIQKLPNDAEI
jgi:Ni,Fe-hydrogenase I large subunit